MTTHPYAPPGAKVESGQTATLAKFSRGLLVLLVAAAGWCIASPFLWAQQIGRYLDTSYWERLSLYKPELVVACLVALSLASLALRRHRLAWRCFAVASVATPMLKMALGSPSYGVWPVSAALLALLAWRVRVLVRPRT